MKDSNQQCHELSGFSPCHCDSLFYVVAAATNSVQVVLKLTTTLQEPVVALKKNNTVAPKCLFSALEDCSLDSRYSQQHCFHTQTQAQVSRPPTFSHQRTDGLTDPTSVGFRLREGHSRSVPLFLCWEVYRTANNRDKVKVPTHHWFTDEPNLRKMVMLWLMSHRCTQSSWFIVGVTKRFLWSVSFQQKQLPNAFSRCLKQTWFLCWTSPRHETTELSLTENKGQKYRFASSALIGNGENLGKFFQKLKK